MSVTRLDEKLKDANIPIVGVSGVQGDVRVWFHPSATVQQKVDAAAIVASFDWTPRRLKGPLALIAEIASLTTADRNKLLAATAADFLRRVPRAAIRLGINIEGDEQDI